MTRVSELSNNAHFEWSERYRVAAQKWVALDSAARILEETKSAVFAEMKTRTITESNENLSEAKAERMTKALPGWREHVRQICDARTVANEAKVQVDFIRMRSMEVQSANANARAEARMG